LSRLYCGRLRAGEESSMKDQFISAAGFLAVAAACFFYNLMSAGHGGRAGGQRRQQRKERRLRVLKNAIGGRAPVE
jgi:hypothetical protein